jgi:hypothetical protein
VSVMVASTLVLCVSFTVAITNYKFCNIHILKCLCEYAWAEEEWNGLEVGDELPLFPPPPR